MDEKSVRSHSTGGRGALKDEPDAGGGGLGGREVPVVAEEHVGLDLDREGVVPVQDLDVAMLDAFVVATEAEELVGVAGLKVYGSNALLRSLEVDAEHRSRGLGAGLVEAIETEAQSRSVTALYRSALRSDSEPNYDGVARLLADDDEHVQTLALEPGTLNVFKGKNTAHRVTPVEGDRPRIVAVFSYYETPEFTFSDPERLGFYGRTATDAGDIR